MGWNKGYQILENTVVAVYDAGALTAELLVEPLITKVTRFLFQ